MHALILAAALIGFEDESLCRTANANDNTGRRAMAAPRDLVFDSLNVMRRVQNADDGLVLQAILEATAKMNDPAFRNLKIRVSRTEPSFDLDRMGPIFVFPVRQPKLEPR